MADVLMEGHNFSKIGKYISNKMHHYKGVRKNGKQNSKTTQSPSHDSSSILRQEKQEQKIKRIKKTQVIEPTVGSYKVNYSAVDKNVHNFDFTRSTPHFFGVKYKITEVTPCVKDYPDGLSAKQKGLTQIGRMTGRQQIKGSIRKNLQNPHQNRFQRYDFPVLTTRTGSVQFAKMSPRHETQRHGLPLPDYDCNYEVTKKRLDSHIIAFEKQKNREDTSPTAPQSEDYRTGSQNPILSKTVLWSKQLPREIEGSLPFYMDKSVNSRMAISLINLKTLQMNCSDMRERRIPKKKTADLKPTIYKQIEQNYV